MIPAYSFGVTDQKKKTCATLIKQLSTIRPQSVIINRLIDFFRRVLRDEFTEELTIDLMINEARNIIRDNEGQQFGKRTHSFGANDRIIDQLISKLRALLNTPLEPAEHTVIEKIIRGLNEIKSGVIAREYPDNTAAIIKTIIDTAKMTINYYSPKNEFGKKRRKRQRSKKQHKQIRRWEPHIKTMAKRMKIRLTVSRVQKLPSRLWSDVYKKGVKVLKGSTTKLKKYVLSHVTKMARELKVKKSLTPLQKWKKIDVKMKRMFKQKGARFGSPRVPLPIRPEGIDKLRKLTEQLKDIAERVPNPILTQTIGTLDNTLNSGSSLQIKKGILLAKRLVNIYRLQFGSSRYSIRDPQVNTPMIPSYSFGVHEDLPDEYVDRINYLNSVLDLFPRNPARRTILRLIQQLEDRVPLNDEIDRRYNAIKRRAEYMTRNSFGSWWDNTQQDYCNGNQCANASTIGGPYPFYQSGSASASQWQPMSVIKRGWGFGTPPIDDGGENTTRPPVHIGGGMLMDNAAATIPLPGQEDDEARIERERRRREYIEEQRRIERDRRRREYIEEQRRRIERMRGRYSFGVDDEYVPDVQRTRRGGVIDPTLTGVIPDPPPPPPDYDSGDESDATLASDY